VVVTIPEPTAITDGYVVIKAVSREKGSGRIRLIVNQSLGPADARRVSERIRTVSRRFLGIEVDDLGFVQADPRVGMAVRRKRPFVLEYPRCPASKCMREISGRIAGGSDTERSRGFLRKVGRTVGGLLG
jgi:flagellar biosynthesis protein FlhG